MGENIKYKAYFENTSISWHKEADYDNGANSYNHCEKDYISILPPELIVRIFQYLTLSEVRKCALVCKQWHKLSSTDVLWRTVEIKNTNLHVDVLRKILDTHNVKTLILETVIFDIPSDDRYMLSEIYMLEHLVVNFHDILHLNEFCLSEVMKELVFVSHFLKSFSLKLMCADNFHQDVTPMFLDQLSVLKCLEKLEFTNICLTFHYLDPHNLEDLQGFNRVKVLSLTGICSSLLTTDLLPALEKFLGLFQNLNELHLTRMELNEAIFGQIVENLKICESELYKNPANHEKFDVLQHFSISFYHYNDTEVNFLEEFLSLSPYLKTLALFDKHRENNEVKKTATFRSNFFRLLLKLRYLEILKLPRMKFKYFKDILCVLRQSNGFDKLKVLNLNEIFDSKGVFIEEFLKLCSNITELILFDTRFTNSILWSLLHMQYLKKLEISLKGITSSLLLSSCNERLLRLEDLHIKNKGCHSNAEPIELMVQASPNLIKLHLENCSINAEILRSINAMNKLRRLCMHNIQGISKDQFYFTVKNYPQFERCNVVLDNK